MKFIYSKIHSDKSSCHLLRKNKQSHSINENKELHQKYVIHQEERKEEFALKIQKSDFLGCLIQLADKCILLEILLCDETLQ